MSSKPVKDAIRAELTAWGAAQDPVVPYVETANDNSKPAANVWCTAVFGGSTREPLDYSGERYIEQGSVDLVVFSRPGLGDGTAADAADSLEAHFRQLAPLANGVEVLEAEGPEDLGAVGTPSGNWYGLSVAVNYERYVQ